MSQELLYTSAPSGLNPTDQGFCTVVCTQGMPRNLKEFLESLSGYRQADKPPHPVNSSHLIHSIAGKRYSVLSQVSDYGKDYSGRTNKLAHHVALTMDELPPSGPAALLGTSLFKASWDGQTRSEPSGPMLPSASAHHGPCRAWEAITGDAGWAGILAESAADGSNRPMYVIFPQGQSVLPLIAEALSVLPREHAWTTSFSTYFTKLPAGVDCLWRFVLDGSPEAKQARIASHGRTIDLVELGRSRRRASDNNPNVIAARAGRVVDSQPATSSGGTFAPSAPSPMATAAATTAYDAPGTPSPFGTTAPASPFAKPFREDKGPSKLPYILGGAALVAVIGVGVLVYSMMTKDIPTPVNASDSVASKNRKTKSAPQLDQSAFLSEKETKRLEAEAKRQAEKTVASPVEVKKQEEKPVVVQTPMETKPKIEGPWDRTLKTKGGYLIIPARPQSLVGVVTPEPMPLAEIHVADPRDIDLKIYTASSDSSVDEKSVSADGFRIKREYEEVDDPIRKWILQRPVQHPVTKALATYEMGTFALGDQSLTFQWNMEAPSWTAPNSLLYCVLELSNGDQSHKFRLSQPSASEPPRYDLTGRGQAVYLEISSNAVKDPKSLLLDFELQGVGSKPFVKNRMKVDDKVKFSIQKTKIKLGDPTIDFEIQFKYDEKKGTHLVFDAYTTRTQLAPITARDFQQLHTVAIVPLRDSSVVTDFDKFIKDTEKLIGRIQQSPQYKLGVLKLPELKQDLNSLESAAANEPDEKKRNEIQDKIGKLKVKINIVNEVIKRETVLEDAITWAEDMGPYFLELQKSAQVGYTLYTEIQGEKIILARTESQGSQKQPKEQNSKPASSDKQSETPKPAPKNETPVAKKEQGQDKGDKKEDKRTNPNNGEDNR